MSEELLNPSLIKPKSSGSEPYVPFDVINLPSKGKVYTDSMKGLTSVEISYMTAKEEDILTTPNLLKSGKVLDYLLKSVLRNKLLDPTKLLIGDRAVLIVWLRSTGYGADYPVELTCKSCGEKFKYTFDLSTLKIQELTLDPDENGLFSFESPLKKQILFKLLTGEDELEINSIIQSQKEKTNAVVEQATTLKFERTIVSVDGDTSSGAIRKYIQTAPINEIRALRKYIESMEPGIDMTQEAVCSFCGQRSVETIPIQPNFFWPDTRI